MIYRFSCILTFILIFSAQLIQAQEPIETQEYPEIPRISLEGIDWSGLEVQYQSEEIRVEPWHSKLDGRARAKQRRYEQLREAKEKGRIDQQQITVDETIDLIISTAGPAARSELEELGFEVRVETENIVAGTLPVSLVTEAAMIDDVSYIQAPADAEEMHNRSRPSVGAGVAHRGGGNLNQAYKGEDIIVGIIDSGLDFRHPDFNTDHGTRLEYLFDYQIRGEEPESWSRDEIVNDPDAVTQEDNISGHGTHVAGSAVGNGRAGSGGDDMTGVAPEADIIAVNARSYNPNTDSHAYRRLDILDGVSRVFDIAEQQQRPAVVNISLGRISGSRDGSSPSEQILDELSGAGKVIVSSAGNSGFLPKHTGSDMRPQQRYVAPILVESSDANSVPVEAWYDPDTLSEFKIVAVNTADEQASIAGSTPWLRPGEELDDNVAIVENSDTLGMVYATATATETERNGDSQIYSSIYRTDSHTDLSELTWVFVANSTIRGGRFDMWVNNNGMFYPRQMSLTRSEQLVGDNRQTIGDPASAKEVISVGNYITRTGWTDRDGGNWTQLVPIDPLDDEDRRSPQSGDLVHYSSKGPLRTGETAPDITAPGYMIFSAKSSSIDFPRNRLHPDGPYRIASGTSMASPHVAGGIALMLQINPDLTADDVRDIFAQTARTDSRTGNVPNNDFGFGKLQIAHALEYLESGQTKLADESQELDEPVLSNYPNPFNPVTTVSFSLPERKEVDITVYDTIGRQVEQLVAGEQLEQGTHEVDFDGSRLSSGMYIIRMKAGSEVLTRQITLIK